MSFWIENSQLIWFVSIWIGLHLLLVHCFGMCNDISIYSKQYFSGVLVPANPTYRLTVFTIPYNVVMRTIGVVAIIITAIDYIKFDFENDFTDARLTWLIFLGLFNTFYYSWYWYYHPPKWAQRRYCTCCVDYDTPSIANAA